MSKIKVALFFFIMTNILITGCSIENRKVIDASTFESLPDNIQIGNYSVDITESTLYENYILTKYTIETLDKSYIPENTINLNILISSDNIDQASSNNKILKELNISQYKKEITKIDFPIVKSSDSLNITYQVEYKKSSHKEKITLDNEYHLKKFKDNSYDYHDINSTITIDDMDIHLKDFLLTDSEGILYFSIKNTQIDKDSYIVKLKSKDFEDIFFIENIDTINTDNIISYYYVPMIYNNKSIDFKNLEIYLTNVNTNTKTLLYKSST